MSKTIALIVAAGRGERMGGGLPKQYRSLAGKPVLRWALEAFAQSPVVDAVRVVIRGEDEPHYRAAVAGLDIAGPIPGGATRQESARNGLEAIAAESPDHVLIHDGARPLVSSALIERVVRGLDTADSVAPLVAVADTLQIGRAHV